MLYKQPFTHLSLHSFLVFTREHVALQLLKVQITGAEAEKNDEAPARLNPSQAASLLKQVFF